MRTFVYRGYDGQGLARRGLVEAADLKEAREKLAARGVLPEQVDLAGSEERSFLSRPRTFGLEARTAFYRELGVLLAAGIPMVHALEILMDSPEIGVSAAVLAKVRDQVREGTALAAALAEAAPEVRSFEKAIIEVGEKSGSLEAILDRLAGFLEEQQQLRERIVSALIYPTIIFTFAVIVAVVMLGFVVPSAAAVLMEQSRAPLPLLTRFMIGAGRVLLWAVPLGLAAAAGAYVWLARAMQQDAGWRYRLDRLLFRLPLVGRGYGLVVNLRYARTLAILLKGGVTLVDSLPLAGRATGSAWVAHLLEAETEAVRHGSTLADAIRRVPVLARSLPAWIQAGEASGALEKMIDTAGDSFQHQWARFVTRTLSYVEPVLIAMIGAFVLLVTLSVLLPILSLSRLMGS